MPDELISRAVYPTIRAMIAKTLIEKYHMNQKEIAEKLGVTQAAISYYLYDKRGIAKYLLQLEDVNEFVNKIAEDIHHNKIGREELVLRIVKLVNHITQTRELCIVHKFFESQLRIEECNLCNERYSPSSKSLIELKKK